MCETQFYTPLQTELNLSSLPIILNSAFHLMPVVPMSPQATLKQCLCVYEEGFAGVINVYTQQFTFYSFLWFHMVYVSLPGVSIPPHVTK